MGRLSGEEIQYWHSQGQKDAAEGKDVLSPRMPDAIKGAFDQEWFDEAYDCYRMGHDNVALTADDPRRGRFEKSREEQEDQAEQRNLYTSTTRSSNDDNGWGAIVALLGFGVLLAVISLPFYPSL